MVGEVTSVVAVGGSEEKETVISERARVKVDSRVSPSPGTGVLESVVAEVEARLSWKLGVTAGRASVKRVLLVVEIEEAGAGFAVVALELVEREGEREVEVVEDEEEVAGLGEAGAVVEEKKGLSSSRLVEATVAVRLLKTVCSALPMVELAEANSSTKKDEVS